MNLAQSKRSQDVAVLGWKARVRGEAWKKAVAARLASCLPC